MGFFTYGTRADFEVGGTVDLHAHTVPTNIYNGLRNKGKSFSQLFLNII